MKKEHSLTSMDALIEAKLAKMKPEERDVWNEKLSYAYCTGIMIRDVRKVERVTQGELARRIGKSKSYVCRMEKGEIAPSAELFYRIMDALGIVIDNR